MSEGLHPFLLQQVAGVVRPWAAHDWKRAQGTSPQCVSSAARPLQSWNAVKIHRLRLGCLTP